MFRSDPQRDGVNHHEHVLNRRNVNRLALAWSQPIGLGNTFAHRPAPVVSDGYVYAGSADGLSAFDADTGEVRWRRKLSIDSSPAVVEAAADGVLYVGGSHLARYGVTAYAAGTGTALWTFYTGFTVPASPVVVDGVVYVRSVDGYMYALDAATGHRIWARQVSEFFSSESESSPAVAGGKVYIGVGGGIEALDATSGDLIWQSACGGSSSEPSPAVVDGVVYVGALTQSFNEGVLCAFDAGTGEVLWSYEPHQLGVPEVAVDRGVVYVVVNDVVLALDAGTGTEIWTREPGVVPGAAPPALANGVLYVAGYRLAAAFDPATGDTLWTAAIDSSNYPASPAIANGRLFISMEDDSLFVFGLP
jgi:eukaryotic-like serine/threonine-protein kinase